MTCEPKIDFLPGLVAIWPGPFFSVDLMSSMEYLPIFGRIFYENEVKSFGFAKMHLSLSRLTSLMPCSSVSPESSPKKSKGQPNSISEKTIFFFRNLLSLPRKNKQVCERRGKYLILKNTPPVSYTHLTLPTTPYV